MCSALYGWVRTASCSDETSAARPSFRGAFVMGADQLVRLAGRFDRAASERIICSLNSEHLPAVDRDVLAGDPAGERRAQEEHDLCYLLRAAQPAERDASKDAAIEVGVVQSGALPGAAGKLDRAGRDAVDPDPFAGEGRGLGKRVLDYRRLDGRVRRGAGCGAKPRDR